MTVCCWTVGSSSFEGTMVLHMLGAIYPVTEHHTPKDLNPLICKFHAPCHFCTQTSEESKLRSWKFSISWVWFRSTLFQGLAVLLLSSGNWKNVLSLYPTVGYRSRQQFPYCVRDATGYFKICLFFFLNLCVLVFQMATDLLGQIVIKLFGPNYLLNRSVRYIFWPKEFMNW